MVSDEDSVEKVDSEEERELKKIFGDDWFGKPGVSSDSAASEVEEDVDGYEEGCFNPGRAVLPECIEVNEEGDKRYRCTICKCNFSSKTQIRYHSFCMSGNKPFQCKLCEKRFVKKGHFKYHMRSHSGERPFKCSVCCTAFSQKDKLIRHERVHLDVNAECPICKKKLPTASIVRTHKLIHEREGKYICKVCSKAFSSSTDHKRHQAMHSGVKKIVCDRCGMRFARGSNLRVHLRTHSGIRQYACSQCSKTFKNKKELQRHSFIHDESVNYVCSICNGKFKRKDNLNRHIKNTHEKNPADCSGNSVSVKCGNDESDSKLEHDTASLEEEVLEMPKSSVIFHTSQVIVRESVIKTVNSL